MRIFLPVVLLLVALQVNLQANAAPIASFAKVPVHKIVFQLTSDDTLVHKSLVKQLNNILTAAPDALIEVVCHNNGVAMMLLSKTVVHPKIVELAAKGVKFVVCENTMKERKIDKSLIVAEAGFVPSGIIEIVTKQEEGWSYLKAGF